MSDAVLETAGSGPGKSARNALRAASMLGVATLLAIVAAAAIFGLVFYGEFLTGAAASTARVMFDHSALAVAAGASPIFAVLLVGYGYMQKGMRRRAAARAAAAGRDAIRS